MSSTGLNVSGASAGRLASPSQFGPRIRMPLSRRSRPPRTRASPAPAPMPSPKPELHDHGDPDPGGGALAQDAGDERGADHHQGQVDRLGDVKDGAVRGHALDLAALAVHRVDRAGEPVPGHEAERPPAERLGFAWRPRSSRRSSARSRASSTDRLATARPPPGPCSVMAELSSFGSTSTSKRMCRGRRSGRATSPVRATESGARRGTRRTSAISLGRHQAAEGGTGGDLLRGARQRYARAAPPSAPGGARGSRSPW